MEHLLRYGSLKRQVPEESYSDHISYSTSRQLEDPEIANGMEGVGIYPSHIITDISSLKNHIQVMEDHNQLQSTSISIPVSPTAQNNGQPIEVKIINKFDPRVCDGKSIHPAELFAHNHLSSRSVKDNCYDSFKTYSARFERQISNLRGRPHEIIEITDSHTAEPEALPSVERYFDALEGPELETLKPSEKLVLPKDEKWPFLLRFTISSFGMPLGVGIQALLWKTIATSPSMSFLHVNLVLNFILWCISLILMILVSFIYILKIIIYFEAVRREFSHPFRVNFFFAPWIGCILLAVSVPPSVAKNLHVALWYALMTPILCLELKIYGQWMLGGERRLSKVANPLNHLTIVGNFVGAMLGSSMGLKEGPVFFFAVGLVHYVVLLVTLYQRLPTNETLPKDLHPVFFLFIAGPSLACLSWTMISGHFDLGSRIAYFMALFLYASLVVRVNFFRGFRFSLVWWAYTVPMTSASIATIRYTAEVDNLFMKILSVTLSFISALTVLAMVISTILHAFVFGNLFPNDNAIAITLKRPDSKKKQSHHRTESSSSVDRRDASADI